MFVEPESSYAGLHPYLRTLVDPQLCSQARASAPWRRFSRPSPNRPVWDGPWGLDFAAPVPATTMFREMERFTSTKSPPLPPSTATCLMKEGGGSDRRACGHAGGAQARSQQSALPIKSITEAQIRIVAGDAPFPRIQVERSAAGLLKGNFRAPQPPHASYSRPEVLKLVPAS